MFFLACKIANDVHTSQIHSTLIQSFGHYVVLLSQALNAARRRCEELEEAFNSRSQVLEMLQQEVSSADQQKRVRFGFSACGLFCTLAAHADVAIILAPAR